jgi:hypothetical protein
MTTSEQLERMADIPPSIERKLEALDKERAEVLALVDVAQMAHAIADLFPDLLPNVALIKWVVDPLFVSLWLHVGKFDEALPVMRDLASRGWHTDKANPYEDYHELDRRTYNLRRSDEGACRLRVMVFLKSDAVCKRVQVGTKVEPVYEFVCE